MKGRQKKEQTAEALLQDLIIIQLGLAGLTQHQVRAIVGVDMNRVTRILKHLKSARLSGEAQ